MLGREIHSGVGRDLLSFLGTRDLLSLKPTVEPVPTESRTVCDSAYWMVNSTLKSYTVRSQALHGAFLRSIPARILLWKRAMSLAK